jgi:hypothetical protein
MEVVFRINQNYLNGKLTHCGSGDITVFKTAVDFWNKTFNIDFFTLRKKLRRISSDILESQTCIKKVHSPQPTKYKNNIYAPMDDDDIFMITEKEYEECVSNFNENCNLIVLGYYHFSITDSNEYHYEKNPVKTFPMMTNNFLCKYEKSNMPCDGWVRDHARVHTFPYIKFKEMKHIETSLHLVHPCSVTLLQPKFIPNTPSNWTEDVKEHRDLMANIVYDYVNETNYKQEVPHKFWTHLETFKSLFSEVKLK